MSEPTNTPENSAGQDHEDGWQPCAPGEISGMVGRIQDRRRAIVVGRTTFAAALVLCVAAASQFSGFSAAEHDCGGIVCSDVMAHLEAYRTGTLDEKTTGQVRLHLEECPQCGPKFRKMTGGSAQLDAGSFGDTVVMAGFAR
ncbi:MAG: zf-HC2 domain-containing protein [Planctomycetota bacterium]|nr:zf-HC2 domain-containing protein [Planctomycetota bacterium]MDA1251047.1 zf-HC2 domain-containing protein [Planctomycetota bacterium]